MAYVTGVFTTITSNNGGVQVTGQGGGGGGTNNYGVDVEEIGEITAGGSGTVTVMGTGDMLAEAGAKSACT